MNRLLIVPGIALLAGGLYFFISDTDNSGDGKPEVLITLGEPTPIGSSEIGTTTVTDAVEFKVFPVSDSSSDTSSSVNSSNEESQEESREESQEEQQAEVAVSDEENSGGPELSVQAGSSEAPTSSEDEYSEDAPAVTVAESESIESDKQPQISDLITHEIVIDSSLYQATNAAGLSANQTARIGKVFGLYLDAGSELRKGDKLIVILDPAAGEDENDADQVHRLEYHGARKTLVITRVEGSLSDYEIKEGDGGTRSDGVSQSSPVVAVESSVDSEPATGDMKRVEGVISVSFFSAAREAGLNAGQVEKIHKILTPYINFNREMRKGDRFVVMLDGEDIYSCEYIGALKQLLATRDDQGAYKVTDKAGVDITVAKGADASTQRQGATRALPEVTQSKPQARGDAKVQLNSRVAGEPAAKVVRKDKSKPAAKVVRKDQSKPAAKVVSKDRGKPVAKVVRKDKSKPVAKIVREDKSKPAAKIVSKDKSKSAAKVVSKDKSEPAVKVVRIDKNKPVVKIVRTEKSNSRLVSRVSPKRSDKDNGSQQSKAKKSFWKSLGFGSSKVAGNNWRPKDRKLAKVFDRVVASGKVEKKALVRAFKYYQENRKSSGLALTYIAIADYTKLATTKRLHIINLRTAGVTSVQVAHGRKSGPIGGRVTSTSNANGSHQTTKGFYRVGIKEGRTNRKGLPYLAVQGLESGNRLVGLPPRKGGRDIIIHTAGYVASGGRSLGCFSIRPQDKRLVFNKLKGALFYSYVG
jgi:hypothetical protein